MKLGSTVVGAAAAIAMMTAPLAGAKPHDDTGEGHGNGHKPKGVAYVFKGTYVDSTSVDVTKGTNSAIRTVSSSLAARIVCPPGS